MSKESKLKFKLKRIGAEVLNVLYYVTVVPFLVHNLYKFCRSLFTSPKRLKLASRFKIIENSSENFDIQQGDIGKNIKIVKKVPRVGESPEENKFKAHWFVKKQKSWHAIREIVTEGVFRLLAGKEHAAKVRLMKDEKTGEIYSISKFFEHAKTLCGMWKEEKENPDRTADYYDFYLQQTENLAGFEEMLVITLLLGRADCHDANWGIVEKDNNSRLAVTFDYGTATEQSPVIIENLLTERRHSYERIVSEKFLAACETVLEKFENSHDEIIEELQQGIEAAEAAFPWWKVPTANDVMRIFTNNKRQLKHLCYQIRAELAVSQSNPKEFEKAIKKVDPAYRFPVLSTQRKDFKFPHYDKYSDNGIIHDATFKNFINEGYKRVFICNSKLAENLYEDTLYLIKSSKKDKEYIGLNRGGERVAESIFKLNQEQAKTIKELGVEFPEKEGKFVELEPDLSQKIISICGCPFEKPLEVRNQLNQVCQTYGIK